MTRHCTGQGPAAEGETRYDYDRQCWVMWDSGAWIVVTCGHPTKHSTCYSCNHAGKRFAAVAGEAIR